MSQPDQQPDDPDRVELDPLLEFNSEPGAAEPPETPVDSAPVAPPAPLEDVTPLTRRLDQAERSLDRAFTDIGVLKSDLATLVNAIDDIGKRLRQVPDPVAEPLSEDVTSLKQRLDQAERSLDRAFSDIGALKSNLASFVPATSDVGKRQSRPPAPVVSAPTVPRRPGGSAWKIAAAAILFIVLGAAIWRVRSLVTNEVVSGEVGLVSSTPLPPPSTPHSPLPTPNYMVQAAASVETPAPSPPVRKEAEREAPAVRYTGTLSIDASPPGEVFIDRKPVGRTPLRLQKLRAGSHLVWIERDGYQRWTRVVTVPADRVSRVAAQLDQVSR